MLCVVASASLTWSRGLSRKVSWNTRKDMQTTHLIPWLIKSKTLTEKYGVFLAYAVNNSYGFVDYELYVPKDWFCDSFETLRKEFRLPEEIVFFTKSEIVLSRINKVLRRGLLQVQWIGCNTAFWMIFLDGLELPDKVWYFAATNEKEQVFLSQPQLSFPYTGRGRPRKHPILSQEPVSV